MMDNVLEHSIDVHGDGSLIKTLIHDCAQERDIKDVTVRCKYRILLTNDDWGRVERDGFNTRGVSYVIALLGYTTFDDIVVEFDCIHPLVFAGRLQQQAHATLVSKYNELRPTSTVTTRRI